jgi:hypothetical protein
LESKITRIEGELNRRSLRALDIQRALRGVDCPKFPDGYNQPLLDVLRYFERVKNLATCNGSITNEYMVAVVVKGMGAMVMRWYLPFRAQHPDMVASFAALKVAMIADFASEDTAELKTQWERLAYTTGEHMRQYKLRVEWLAEVLAQPEAEVASKYFRGLNREQEAFLVSRGVWSTSPLTVIHSTAELWQRMQTILSRDEGERLVVTQRQIQAQAKQATLLVSSAEASVPFSGAAPQGRRAGSPPWRFDGAGGQQERLGPMVQGAGGRPWDQAQPLTGRPGLQRPGGRGVHFQTSHRGGEEDVGDLPSPRWIFG